MSGLDPLMALLLKPKEIDEILLFQHSVRGQHARSEHTRYPRLTNESLDRLSDDECRVRFR